MYMYAQPIVVVFSACNVLMVFRPVVSDIVSSSLTRSIQTTTTGMTTTLMTCNPHKKKKKKKKKEEKTKSETSSSSSSYHTGNDLYDVE
jgi:hypothetical protein